jgi:hypothetical protein
VNAGWEPLVGAGANEKHRELNRMMHQSPRVWENCRHDAFTFQAALDYLRSDAPRVFFIALGDTDEYAHEGRYDRYLRAAHNVDTDLRLLWETLQSQPEYRGSTALLVTTDHGRGGPPRAWRDHGAKVSGADAIWIAALGPDVPALGERHDTDPVTQAQVAATVAAMLGEDLHTDLPKAAPALAEFLTAPKAAQTP